MNPNKPKGRNPQKQPRHKKTTKGHCSCYYCDPKLSYKNPQVEAVKSDLRDYRKNP